MKAFGFNKTDINNDFISILKQNYIKVLCANLKTKQHEDIFLREKEGEDESYSENIDEWLNDFADKSYVYKDDVEYYKRNTDIEFLKAYFETHDDPFKMMYRRLQEDEYKWVEMNIIKSSGYTKDTPVVIICVMDAQQFAESSARENQGILDCYNMVVQTKGIEVIIELLKYTSGFYGADDVYISDTWGNIIYEYNPEHLVVVNEGTYYKCSIDENMNLIIVGPKKMKGYHVLYRCVAYIIYRILLDAEIERKYIIEKRQNRIINALSKRFFTIYRVDLLKSEGYLVYAPNYVKKILMGHRDTGEILNIMEENLVSKEYVDIVHEFNDYTKWPERLAEEESISVEFKGTNRWSRIVLIVATRDEENRATEILYAVQDIDAEKIREEEQALKLREALKKANEASQSKSRFLSNMSHDIRTPMNAIVGFTHLAKQNLENKDLVNEYLDEISVAGKHLVSLINEVLDMSHIESGKMEINPKSCDISELLNKVRDIMSTTAKERNVSIELEIGEITHHKILCDELKINQILFNIIGNSVKYNKENGTIYLYCNEFSSSEPGTGIYELVVKDTGIGMSKEFLAKIFDTFEREQDALESNIQGTGLGMSITKGLVELMGGTIEMESEKNVGTTCTIKIPFVWDINSEEEKKKAEESPEAVRENIKNTKVLLVEDNLVNQKLATAIFKSLGISIDIAGDGVKALKALEEKGEKYYEVIFMDMQMPVMNGIEATAAIRALDKSDVAKTPIIMMTANVFEEDKEKAYNAGANGYVAKPIDVDALLMEMARVLKESE